MSSSPFHSVFDHVHDVAIFGGGYAGFAAARTLIAAGKKVLLVDRRAAILAESSWSFEQRTGSCPGLEWEGWCNDLGACGGLQDGLVDGAIAEILATRWQREERQRGTLSVLYYATPLAIASGNDGMLDAVLVGTKGGPRKIAARQWIDATETAELVRLFAAVQEGEPAANWQEPPVLLRSAHLYFCHANWPDAPLPAFDRSAVPGARLQWRTTPWQNERCLTVTANASANDPAAGAAALEAADRTSWPRLLKIARAAAPDALADAVLTHASVEGLNIFERTPQRVPLPHNVVAAPPWMRKGTPDGLLASYFEMGVNAGRRLLDSEAAAPDLAAPFEGQIQWREEQCEVAVAGTGTGGALAALAAARQGADVLAFDPLPFCGGIGAGGGIHWYYFGVKGGLQEELDGRQREIMPLFGSSAQVQGFHPDGKKCILETMLRESGARLLFGATLLDVARDGDRVTHAFLATPRGPVRLEAQAWIDGTGDGDLAARAGAGVRFGRDGDGLVHAYSQSGGHVYTRDGRVFMGISNFDAGFVDSTDSEDLTRARLEGISQYSQREYTADKRPTYIAPAIGLRQSRQIETDYTLQLADLIERSTFEDSVGLTGCHYDNHATDYEFESDEALFWVWVCRQWRGRTGCEIPYRILLPQGLDNVWLACRALGVSQDAHHSLRMQRDMQRIGEVAGIAAALSRSTGGASREIEFGALRAVLESSGAVQRRDPEDDPFGPDTKSEFLESLPGADIGAWLGELGQPEPGPALWHLYRAGDDTNPAVARRTLAREGVLSRLDDAAPLTAWHAAAIAAMWCDARAEAVLLRAIERRHEPDEATYDNRTAPPWLAALSLLRRVGSAAAIPVLDSLASEPGLVHNARTAVALACEAIGTLNPDQLQQVLVILGKLLASPAPNAVSPPQRMLIETYSPPAGPEDESATARGVVLVDWTWQLHLAVARARHAMGLPPHQQAIEFLQDERALVRRAFTAVATESMIAV